MTNHGQGIGAREIDELGSALSGAIECSVYFRSYELYGKPAFTCKYGLIFPKFAIQGAIHFDDWSDILARHNGTGHD